MTPINQATLTGRVAGIRDRVASIALSRELGGKVFGSEVPAKFPKSVELPRVGSVVTVVGKVKYDGDLGFYVEVKKKERTE